AVLADFDAVAAGGPAVRVADVEVGDLCAGGHVLVVLGHDLAAVQVGPARAQAARLAVGLHRGVDGVAAGKRGERRGDAVVGTDRVAEAEAGGGGGRCQHRRRRGGGRLGGGGRRHDGVGFFPAAAGEGGDGDGRGQQGLDGIDRQSVVEGRG